MTIHSVWLCNKCNKTVPITEFYTRPERKSNKKSHCKACVREKSRLYRINNREKVAATKKRTVAKKPEQYKALAKRGYLRRKQENGGKLYTEQVWATEIRRQYGITADQYKDKLKAQNSACAICNRRVSEKLCVDHCHTTKKVRGLLCKDCNWGLGHFKDNPAFLSQAIHYLSIY